MRKALTTLFDSIAHPIKEVTAAISQVATDQGAKDNIYKVTSVPNQ